MKKDPTVEHRGLKCSHKLNEPVREERQRERGGGGTEKGREGGKAGKNLPQ